MLKTCIFRSLRSKMTAWAAILAVCSSLLAPSASAGAFNPVYSSTSTEPVAAGVTLDRVRIQTTDGPLNVYVTKVDLTNPYVRLDTLVGTDGILTQNQTVSQMARKSGAVAAINGDFFQMDEKAPLGIAVQNGHLVASPEQRTDMFGFALTTANQPIFPIFGFSGTVAAPNDRQFSLYGVNKPSYLADKGVSSDLNRLNMYTPQWGLKSRGVLPGLTGTVEVVVDQNTVREIRTDQPGVEIPVGGYVLAGQGQAGQFLTENFKVGDPVRVSYRVTPDLTGLTMAVGGQTLLVESGQRRWFTQNIAGNKARTAIGASQDGKTLYLVVVDGGKTSRGMTQEELADFLVSLGVWTALNLDGGGSSTLAIRQLGDQTASLINSPANASERPIPTALGVFSTAPAGELAGLKISGPELMVVGTEKTYAAKGYDQNFNPFPVQAGQITWSIAPELGQFTGGRLVATGSGYGTVKAAVGDVTQDYPVRLVGKEDITSLQLFPGVIKADPGDSFEVSVKVTTRQGEVYFVSPADLNMQVSGGIGTFNGSRFTAGETMAVGEMTASVDSVSASARVSVGRVERDYYGFEAGPVLKFSGSPEGAVSGSFRFTEAGEPALSAGSAGRLEFDFGESAASSATGIFEGGLPLPGEPLGLSLRVLAPGLAGFNVKGQLKDASGVIRIVDFSPGLGGPGWQRLTADVPNGVKYPAVLTNVTISGGKPAAGKMVVYLDDLALQYAPEEADLGQYTPELPGPLFSDTADSWAKILISDMAARGIINGYTDGRFLPNKGVTRAELITLMAKTLGWQTAGAVSGPEPPAFKDQLPAWAKEAVLAAVSRGVVKGYADGTFRADKLVTRAEMAVMLDKAMNLPASGKPSDFADGQTIPAWALPSVMNAKEAGILQGSGNQFRPGDPANRAEAAAVMAKIMPAG